MIVGHAGMVVEVIAVVMRVMSVIVVVEEPVEVVVGIVMEMGVVIVPVRPIVGRKIVLSSAVEVLQSEVSFRFGERGKSS